MKLPNWIKNLIGREGKLKSGELEISVMIIDARLKPCNVEYLVEVTAGRGQKWVGESEVILETQE